MSRLNIKNRKLSKLGVKFIAVTLPLIAVFIALVGVSSISNERKILYTLLDNLGTSITQATASFSVEPLLVKDYPVLQTYTDNLVESNDAVISVEIFRKDGQLVAQSDLKNTETEHRQSYTEAVQVFPGSKNVVGKVVVSLTSEQFESLLQHRIFEGLVSAFVLFTLLSSLIFILMKKLVTEPLCLLDKQASAMGEGDLDSTIALKKNDELGHLAGTLDMVREKLKLSYSQIETQNEDLKGLDRMKDEFLATMSHELRTPLNAIIGYSEIAVEDVESNNHRTLASDLLSIGASAKHLLAIVDDVLDLSRLASGNTTLKLRTSSLSGMAEELETVFLPLLKKNDNRLVVEADHYHDTILVDSDRLKQVLINVLCNANKFTRGGVIKLSTRQEKEGDTLWNYISVADNGVGIEKQFIEKIFISFFQIDSSTTREFEGAGLGLTICSKLCKCMGGDIFAESSPKVGTVFTVKIPSSLAASEESQEEAPLAQANIISL